MTDLIRDEYGIKANAEAEASVIGAMLVSGEIVPQVMGEITADKFLIPEYRTLCNVCFETFLAEGRVDPVSVSGRLSADYRVLIATCVQMVPSTKNWRSYVDIVLENHKRYRLFAMAIDVVKNAKHTELPVLEKELLSVIDCFHSSTRKDTWSAKEGFVNFMTEMQRNPDYQQTGILNLDKHLYLESGDFVVIGARPSVGKTAFGVQLMLNMAKKYKVGFFSLETSFSKIFGRAIGNYTSTPQSSIKTRENLDTVALGKAFDGFGELDLHVIEAAGWTTGQIQAKAVQLGLDIAIVDYLQKVNAAGSGRYEKVTEVSQNLADMARSRKITTIALAQLNREGKGEPTMEDLKESGQIEQDADAILLLHSLEKNQDLKRKLYIAKNKEGITGSLDFLFDGNLQRFVEEESRYTEVKKQEGMPWYTQEKL